MVYFSQLRNSQIYDSKNVEVGKLLDLVFLDGTTYAKITHVVYYDNERIKKKIPWGFVKEFRKDGREDDTGISIYLDSPIDAITQFFVKEKEVLLGDILDKQVIDVDGVKVVRINDIIMGKVGNDLCIVAVCVGTLSFIRRLGIPQVAKLAPSRIKEQVIPWKSIERLEKEFHDLHLKVQKNKIADLHPEDIADIMEDLTQSQRILIFDSLNTNKAAKTLIKADTHVRDSVLKTFKIEKVKELLENIPTDQAADIISLMPKAKGKQILSIMNKDISSKVRKILDYYPESIGSIMKTEFIPIPINYTAQKAIELLRKLKPQSNRIYHLYVVDKANHLVGVLSIRALLVAEPKSIVSNFMNRKVIFVKDNAHKDTAARLMARYDLLVLPVIDKEGILRGIVRADDVLDEYIPKRIKRQKFLPLKLKAHKNENNH